jgi:predicted PurR-regulated permease PerM
VFFLLNFFLFFIVLFFLYKDGHFLTKKLFEISPLPEKYNKELYEKFKEVSHGTIFGLLGTAVYQGIMGGLGFYIVGISSPFLWGTLIMFAALIPLIGTVIIWVPAVLILFFQGQVGLALFLAIWSVVLVSFADNVIRSYLIKGKIKMHTLLTFFSLIGGFMAWGFIGLIIGPLVLVLTFTLLHIFTLEYKQVSIIKKEPEKPTQNILLKKIENKIKGL